MNLMNQEKHLTIRQTSYILKLLILSTSKICLKYVYNFYASVKMYLYYS